MGYALRSYQFPDIVIGCLRRESTYSTTWGGVTTRTSVLRPYSFVPGQAPLDIFKSQRFQPHELDVDFSCVWVILPQNHCTCGGEQRIPAIYVVHAFYYRYVEFLWSLELGLISSDPIWLPTYLDLLNWSFLKTVLLASLFTGHITALKLASELM